MIPFNIPLSTGEELIYIQDAIRRGHIAGNGHFTRLCRKLVEELFGFKQVFFTPSCTHALEMAALLCDFKSGDEVIIPSFTHVGTGNAFLRSGVKIRFCDVRPDDPHLDPASVQALIGPATRAIVLVHYAGIACDMEAIYRIAHAHNIVIIEDAAHAIGARYDKKWLGSLGDFAAFSFHETKNITSGHGGMLVVNKDDLLGKATQIWNQGTNRNEFEKGSTPYYIWSRQGGSFQMPELNAAFLYAQLLRLKEVNERRMQKWKQYYDNLFPLEKQLLFTMPDVPGYAVHNAHIFYLIMKTAVLRDSLLKFLNNKMIGAVFHYIPLHTSICAETYLEKTSLPNTEHLSGHLIRLPLYDSLLHSEIENICTAIREWIAQNLPDYG
jgi:dTDP-4-amino-4,6-dideoxygalactose transaminase